MSSVQSARQTNLNSIELNLNPYEAVEFHAETNYFRNKVQTGSNKKEPVWKRKLQKKQSYWNDLLFFFTEVDHSIKGKSNLKIFRFKPRYKGSLTFLRPRSLNCTLCQGREVCWGQTLHLPHPTGMPPLPLPLHPPLHYLCLHHQPSSSFSPIWNKGQKWHTCIWTLLAKIISII